MPRARPRLPSSRAWWSFKLLLFNVHRGVANTFLLAVLLELGRSTGVLLAVLHELGRSTGVLHP